MTVRSGSRRSASRVSIWSMAALRLRSGGVARVKPPRPAEPGPGEGGRGSGDERRLDAEHALLQQRDGRLEHPVALTARDLRVVRGELEHVDLLRDGRGGGRREALAP